MVLDEAYAEYVDAPGYQDSLALRKKYPNLVVLRTFSKIYGLAGLRVGYGLARPDLVEYLDRVRAPFNVNHVAQAAGRRGARRRRARGPQPGAGAGAAARPGGRAGGAGGDGGARRRGTSSWPTSPAARPRPSSRTLLREGVIVRPLAGYGFPNAQRITVGLPSENEKCLAALRKVLSR